MTNERVLEATLGTLETYLKCAMHYRRTGNEKLEKEFMQMHNWITYLLPKIVDAEKNIADAQQVIVIE